MKYLEGEIDIERCMAFVERRRGIVEWIALKEYWRADDEEKPIVMGLYGEVLSRGLNKWSQRRFGG